MTDKRNDVKIIRSSSRKDSPKDVIKQNLFEIGKMQPQALELEEAVLGAIMLEKECARIVLDFLPEEAFYKEAHERIYKAILALYNTSTPIDILTVTNELKRSSELELVGGAYYITSLTNRVASSANVEFHARIIYQKFIQRELIRIATQSIQGAYSDDCDIFELLDENYNLLNTITGRLIKSPAKGSAKLFAAFMRQLDTISNSDSVINGTPTLLTKVNNITKGFQDSDLVIIASRPSMGKTASIKTIAKGCMLVKKKKVLIFSLEMSSMQLIGRFMSEDVQISADSFNSKDFLNKTNYNALNSAITGYFNDNNEDLLIIDDTPGLTINELRARAKKICAENMNSDGTCQIGEIIVDYIGKVKGGGRHENKAYEIGDVTSGLKALAKELNIPVIAYSQLNRECEKRNPPKPILSDLRSSGEIEQDADVVIFLYRPEYYGRTEDEEGMSTIGHAEWIFAKQRNGETGTVLVRFIDYLTKFQDMYESIEDKPKEIGYNPQQGLTPNDKFWDAAKKDDDPF